MILVRCRFSDSKLYLNTMNSESSNFNNSKERFNQLKELTDAEFENIPFSEDQYIKEGVNKSQIVLHHSAGWDNARGMFAGWQADKQRVATCCGIDDSGKIYRAFLSRYWAWHVNIMSKGNSTVHQNELFKPFCNMKNAQDVERRTVAVEVCNWGSLTYRPDSRFRSSFHTWASTIERPITIDENKVITYDEPFRGYRNYEKYTEQEVDSLYRLVKHWMLVHNIKFQYDESRFWNVSQAALRGDPGVYAHVSFRADKQDLHPQLEIKQMLTALSGS